uniref:tRNA(Ile)-lysidine synthase n=1 Tax=Choreocolax polysiphoniae TaxID=282351 RepID=A0A0B5VQE9_9FLOR|nr:tRNA(Ile)-lysidine synthase [Choreocolax polysiphoniae]AJH65837.1 tRNA(Ile)-lysidine synthase [Choreocolax polysiphoniae]
MNKYSLQEFKYLFNKIIYQYSITSILIAISGGQDSICLIKFINHLKEENSFNQKLKISYIYIDHQWKNNSYKQIKQIINYIKLIKGFITIYQIKKILITENKCRINRYNIICKHALKYNYQLVITGHNQTDKIETFIQNLIRGSGIEGLTSLTLKVKLYRNKLFFRPLLNITREMIYWFCKRFYLPIWSDNTNYIYQIQRNRIRNELLPYIKKYFHHNAENNIKYLLYTYYYDNEYIKQNTIKLYLKNRHNKYISIKYTQIIKQNFTLQLRIIQLFYFHNLQFQIEYKKVIKIIKLINENILNSCIIIKYNFYILQIYKKWLYITITNNFIQDL